jgi:hypothetical protein
MRRVLLALALVAGVLWPPTTSAIAESTPPAIATVEDQTPISAGDGWLVWSVPSHGEWLLDAYHDRTVETLPAKPRPQPFDVSVGTNSSREPVATFSRCHTTPIMQTVGAQQAGGLLTEPSTGAGCRVYEFNLLTQRERAVPIPHPAETSDTTPSMSHGNVAFARTEPTHPNISEVMLYSPNDHQHELVTLRHGAVPSPCPKPACSHIPIFGEVEALDLDAQAVAFLWQFEGPGVPGHGAWEYRADNLSSGAGSFAGAAALGESCVGGGAVEEAWPSPPVLTGSTALLVNLQRGECYKRYSSGFTRYQRGTRSLGESSLPIMTIAREANITYALVAPGPTTGEQDPNCPCTLQRITPPTLKPITHKPEPPTL